MRAPGARGWRDSRTLAGKPSPTPPPPPPPTCPQADRPLWDARAAALLLLMARAAGDGAALRALGGASFFTGLLGEPDARVRHYASVFVLRELQLQHPLQYRCVQRGGRCCARTARPALCIAAGPASSLPPFPTRLTTHSLPRPPAVLPRRRALRGVVARAQAAADERLLANPYLQLRVMLELGRVQLEAL